MKRLLTLLFCAFSVTLSLLAQGFSGSGSGTKTDPYRIFNADQLNQVRNFLGNTGVYFSLEADIDLAPWLAENNPYEGWQPIGTSSSPFRGTFNGNGHTISNLTINRPTTDYVGLFGYCADGACVKDITLTDCSITGHDYVGSISGCISIYPSTSGSSSNKVSYNANISECKCIGKVLGRNSVGGFIGATHLSAGKEIGYTNDTITVSDLEFYGEILGTDSVGGGIGSASYGSLSYYNNIGHIKAYNIIINAPIKARNCVGGIIGNGKDYYSDRGWHGYGYIDVYRTCHVGDITGSDYIGGIIGDGGTTGKINISESTHFGTIKGNDWVGGIGGYLTADIGNCLVASDLIFSKQMVGGLYGGGSSTSAYNYTNIKKISGENVYGIGKSTVKSCVAINGTLIASSSVDRIGSSSYNGNSGTSSENKAWVLTKMQLNDTLRTPIEGLADGTNIGLSALKLKATYQGIGWDFGNAWDIQETETFPYLKIQTAPVYFTGTLKAGQTSISGQCVEAGTVTVKIGDKEYSASSDGNTWTVTVDPLQGGETAEIMVRADGKFPSYPVYADIELAGSGTTDDPYLVASAEDLRGVTQEDAYYKLTKDIDLTQWITDNYPTGGWQPVGDDIYGVSIAELDGDGHKITGLWIDNDELENVGLFSRIKGEIKNLYVEIADNKSISGTINVGAIAGKLRGTTTACAVKGNLTQGMYVGCIAGSSTGNVTECRAEGAITNTTDSAHIGGLAGSTSGIIGNSYTDVTIQTTGSGNYCGGVTGYNAGSVSHCYARGNVSGNRIGGVVGYNTGSEAKINGCVALNQSLVATTSAQRVLGGYDSSAPTPSKDNYALSTMSVSINNVPQTIYDDPLNGYAKTDNDLMTQATYATLGWTFTTPWTVYDGFTYPFFTRDEVKATSLVLSQSTIELESGESLTLTATLLPTNATLQALTWTSSDETIATVTQDGKVTAKTAGQTIITVSTNDGSNLLATCTINSVTGISQVVANKGVNVTARDHTIYISGASANATVTLYDSRGAMLYHGTSRAISISQSGVYVVVIDGLRIKVCL